MYTRCSCDTIAQKSNASFLSVCVFFPGVLIDVQILFLFIYFAPLSAPVF